MLKLWLVTFLIAAVLAGGQYFIRRKRSAVIGIISIVVKILIAVAASMLAIGVNALFIWRFQYELVALNIALIADCAVDLCLTVMWIVAKKSKRDKVPAYGWTVAVSVIFTAAYLLYGTLNYGNTGVTSYSVESNKVSKPYKVAFISDMHFGDPQNAEMLGRAVDLINEAAPDFVILGGDVTDDYSTKEQMEEAYRLLGGISSDTYFIYGNHDRQPDADMANGPQYSEAELVKAIEGAGIKILKDELVQISDEFLLLGREDETMKAQQKPAETFAVGKDKFLLTAAHSPFDTDDILALGADVQLSGHTHASQTLPNYPVYILMKLRTYGTYDVGNTKTIVSSGEGTWSVPFRTQGHSEIVILTVSPSE